MNNRNGRDARDGRDEIEFNLISHIGVIARYQTGWTKELNIVSWNGGAAKYDIRDWNPEHSRMNKGITLHKEEAKALVELLLPRFTRADAPRIPDEMMEEAEAPHQTRHEEWHGGNNEEAYDVKRETQQTEGQAMETVQKNDSDTLDNSEEYSIENEGQVDAASNEEDFSNACENDEF